MSPEAPQSRHVARLECGHAFPVPPLGLPPRPGQWVTCPDGRCQGQRRVAAVRAVPVVYVQEMLL